MSRKCQLKAVFFTLAGLGPKEWAGERTESLNNILEKILMTVNREKKFC